jgi:hypothetical protein
MSPGYGGYQSTTPSPCYPTTTFAPTGYYTEGHNYYTTKAPEYYTATNAAPLAKSPKILSTTPRLPSITQFLATTPRLQLITPPKRLNTTPSSPRTSPPRLQSITPQLVLPRGATPKPRSITLPQATQIQLRRPSKTQPRLTTQRLLLRTTLNRNTTPRLQFTTPQPTLHLATTPRPYTTKAPEYYKTT